MKGIGLKINLTEMELDIMKAGRNTMKYSLLFYKVGF